MQVPIFAKSRSRLMADKVNFVPYTSKDHEGETVYLSIQRVDLVYKDEDGGSIVVIAGWDDVLHIEETPETFLGLARKAQI